MRSSATGRGKGGHFYILDGVRRALACRDAGLQTVPAFVYREGRNPEYRARMRLTDLFSPKDTVLCDLRFLQIVPPIEEPLEVEALGAPTQTGSVPLATVRLV